MKALKDDIKQYPATSLALLVSLGLASIILLITSMTEVVAGGSRALMILSALGFIIAMTSARHPLRFHGTETGMLVSEALTFLAIILFGPYHGTLLSAVDPFLASRRLKLRPSLYIFNISNHAISAYLAGKLYHAVAMLTTAHELASGPGQRLLAFALPTIALALSYYLLNIALLASMARLSHGTSIKDTLRDTMPWEPVAYVADAIAAAVVSYVASHYGLLTMLVTLVLVLPVPILVYYMFKAYQDKLAGQQRHYMELTDINDSILEMLAMAIDAKDQTTHEHIQRVRLFARRIGQTVGLSEPELEALKAGALLHDIGKIGVPAYILNKPGKLSEHEFEQMKMHTIIGADMLSNINFRYPVVPIVRHHHERWDGRGYPDGLKGEEIPLTARILTLVDNYDALRSDRPYHKAMSAEQAVDYIKRNSGTFFDPKLVDIFASVADRLEVEASSYESGLERSRRSARARRRDASSALRTATPAAGLDAPVDRAAAALHRVAESNLRVAALFEVSRTLAGSLSLEDAVAILANRFSVLIPFTTCAISLFDPSRSEFEFVHAVGAEAKSFIRHRQPVSSGITGWVIQNQTPMYNTNPVLDLGFLGTKEASQFKTVMVFPLLKNGEVFGAIGLYSTEIDNYASEHILLMESIVQPVADSVHNALAFEQAQRAALIDPLTGLANMRAFTTQFEREHARSRRSGMPLSVAVATLENLTWIEASGGLGGEQLLATVGDLIRSRLRETDLVARHTSDTFIILLGDSGPAETAEALSRIRASIEDLPGVPRVSLSLGAAARPDDGETLEELIQAAHLNRVSTPDQIQEAGPAQVNSSARVRPA